MVKTKLNRSNGLIGCRDGSALELDWASQLLGQRFGQPRVEVVSVLVVDPAVACGVIVEMPSVGARRQPDLQGRAPAAQHEAAAVGKFDRQRAIARVVID